MKRNDTMERLKVGIDMDGTLAKSHESIIDAYNSINRTSLSKSDITSWDDPGTGFMTHEEFNLFHYKAWEERWSDILPYASQDTLTELSESCDVEIVTGIPYSLRESVNSWLRMNFQGMAFEVRHVQISEKPFLGYDVLFDDANPVAEYFMKNNRKDERLYLIEQPWNKACNYHLMDDRIKVVKDLDSGIRELISDIRRM